MFARSADWWKEYKLADPEHWRRDAGSKFQAALEVDGAVEGFVIYRIKSEWSFDPGSPLFLMVEDPRRLHLQIYEGVWLRFVDLEAALRARSYATDDSVVIEVRDELCPWNEGRWRVGNQIERTDDEAELELDVRDLACAYLGAFDFHRLADAERVRELRAGALGRASALFRTSRPPYCPEDF